MKRKLLTFLVALFMMFTITSCDVYTYATTQDDIYVESDVDVVRSNVSFDVIIQYGTPYYRDGVLLYYLYLKEHLLFALTQLYLLLISDNLSLF